MDLRAETEHLTPPYKSYFANIIRTFSVDFVREQGITICHLFVFLLSSISKLSTVIA
jgi:hypothetical protein